MKHMHYQHALEVLSAQPFTEEEMSLLLAAGEDVNWEAVAPIIPRLTNPATAEEEEPEAAPAAEPEEEKEPLEAED